MIRKSDEQNNCLVKLAKADRPFQLFEEAIRHPLKNGERVAKAEEHDPKLLQTFGG